MYNAVRVQLFIAKLSVNIIIQKPGVCFCLCILSKMGQGKSQFTEEELQDYEDLTYFTKKEVLYAHTRFKALAPEKVGHNKNAKLPMAKILQYPELRVNPFRDRICKVFSSSSDGDCTFEDFLDMMSVFSDNAPKAVKAEHAFRIFDFDGDDMIGVSDLREVIERLCGPELQLADSELQQLVQNVLEEADLDDDGALSFAEFEHIIDKSSDFTQTFRIRL
ncbi:calcium and integrin-binding protein 1-like [Cydia splendana]|uniref:calcium and integrin-binding protein 1-like n=1 Tax=Cydia splendana TaxID=1100963 RepID=UPI00213C6507